MIFYDCPQLTQNLPRGNAENLAHDSLFIASEDFKFENLPILEGSIVKRIGDTVWVNIIRTYEVDGHLQGLLVRENDNDPFQSNVRVYVKSGRRATFVQLEGSENLHDIPRALEFEPRMLIFQGIEFSSVAYGFDISNKGLLGLQ